MTAEQLLQLILDKQQLILDKLTTVATNQTTTIDNINSLQEVIIAFGNIGIGLVIGYLGVKGLTKPWS